MSCRNAPERPAGIRQKRGPAALRLVPQPAGQETQSRSMLDPERLGAALARDLDGTFERLVREFQDRLFTFACRFAGNPQDAEEIAQDAFVRAYRALKTYPAERIESLGLKPWLYQITLNVARNRARRKKLRLVSLDGAARSGDGEEAAAFDPPADSSERPDARLEARQRRADLATLVADLPERYRAPLILRYVEDLRLDEVAGILNQPLGTTKSNVHRAINALRTAITESRRARR